MLWEADIYFDVSIQDSRAHQADNVITKNWFQLAPGSIDLKISLERSHTGNINGC